MGFLKVFVATFPFEVKEDIYCLERKNEIENVKNEDIKKQKFYVWKLLEIALNKYLNLDLADIKFTHLSSGKWLCNKCNFSLSHSDNVVCVALSDVPVGVDIQVEKNIEKKDLFKKHLLNDNELKRIPDDYLLETFVMKEAMFKESNEVNFVPKNFDILSTQKCQFYNLTIDNKTYKLAVCCDNIKLLEIDSNNLFFK